jgi:transcriptional regulator
MIASPSPCVGQLAPEVATRETLGMRPNPIHASDDPEVVRQLIRENPWCTLVSSNAGQLVASHYPVLLDEASTELAMLTHVGRPDEKVHGLGQHEIMVIVQGRHGYISPSWYTAGTTPAPTWNFSVAHCYGVPQILDAEENMRVLTQLVEHFERHVEQPLFLDPEKGAQLAKGTVGLRIPITRFVCKIKLSHDKSLENQHRVMAALREPGPYHYPELADDMARALAD